jgi:hypothetical protein
MRRARIAHRTALVAIAIAGTLAILSTTATATDTDAGRMYAASELQIFAETFRGDFVKLWKSPSASTSAARAEIARRQIEKHFSGQVLGRLMVEQFAARAESAEFKAALAWTSTPDGKSISGRPRTSHDSDIYSVLESYAETNSIAPLEQARVKLLARIAREALLDQIYISSTSVAALLVSLTLAVSENTSEGVPRQAWDKMMPGLFAKASESRDRYTQVAAGILQMQHQHASNTELAAYLAFRQSPDGRWLSRESAVVFLDVMKAQQEFYVDNLQRIYSKIE